jgi:hypothetical protein
MVTLSILSTIMLSFVTVCAERAVWRRAQLKVNMSPQVQRPETLALHAGWRADAATGAVAVPIYQPTSYQFRTPSIRPIRLCSRSLATSIPAS